MVIGAAAAVLLILGAGGAWWLLRSGEPAQPVAGASADQEPAEAGDPPAGDGGGAETGSETREDTPPLEQTTIPDLPTEEPPVDPEQEALARLEQLAGEGLAEVTLDGRYVAQLASKYPGIVDPLQTTADGSHTFRAADILAEHEWLRTGSDSGARVVLLRSDTYGKRQLVDGRPLYVTFALGDFAGAADVRIWCAGRFPGLSTEARENQCAVRRLRSPA